MIYIIILMYFLGSFMAYISLKGDNIEKSEKILWVAFLAFSDNVCTVFRTWYLGLH